MVASSAIREENEVMRYGIPLFPGDSVKRPKPKDD